MTIYFHSLRPIVHSHELGSITGVLGYESRALSLGNDKDTVVLSPRLKPLLPAVLEHYHRCGLSYCGEVVFSDSPEVLKEWPEEEISVFLHMRELLPYTQDEKRLEAVEFFGNKNAFLRWLLHNELAIIPQTHFCETPQDALNSPISFPLMFKRAVSDSGVAICRCSTQKQLHEAIEQFGNKPFQLQECLPNDTRWLNVQFYGEEIDGKPIASAIELTEQVLEGFTHAGNRTVGDDEQLLGVWDVFTPVATAMVKRGLRGVFGIDVAVAPDYLQVGRQSLVFLAVECNPRWNGSSYPTRIADIKKLNVPSWTARYCYFNKQARAEDFFAALDKAHLTYNPDTKQGVVVYNWGCIPEGKAGVMLIGTPTQQKRLWQELSKTLATL